MFLRSKILPLKKKNIYTNWKRTINPQTHNFFCTNSGILNLFRHIHLMYTYMCHFPVYRIVYFDCKSFFFVCFDPRLWHTSLSRQIWSPTMLIGRDACPSLHFRGDAFRTNRRWAGFLGVFRALLQRAVRELVSSSSLWSREQLRPVPGELLTPLPLRQRRLSPPTCMWSKEVSAAML